MVLHGLSAVFRGGQRSDERDQYCDRLVLCVEMFGGKRNHRNHLGTRKEKPDPLRDETRPPLDIWKDLGADSFAGQYFSLLKENMENADDGDKPLWELAAKLSREILDGEEVLLP